MDLHVHDEADWKQEEDNPTLHVVTAFLLYDGRNSGNDVTFEMMQAEAVFPRLVDLIQTSSVQEDTRLHQMLLELMYESSRIQRLSWQDLSAYYVFKQHVVCLLTVC
jgi:hypothetical protein